MPSPTALAGYARAHAASLCLRENRRAFARAEAGWLIEPEPNEACHWCSHNPCSCDAEYETFRDERLLDD